MKRLKKENPFQRVIVVCMTIGLFFTQIFYTVVAEERPWEPSEQSIHDLTKSSTADQHVGTPRACLFAWDVSLDSEEVESQSLEELNQTILEKSNLRIYIQPHDDPDNLLTSTTIPQSPKVEVLLADLQQLKTVNESLPQEQTLLQKVHLVVTGHYEGTMGIYIHLEGKPHSGDSDGNGSGEGGGEEHNGTVEQNTSVGNGPRPLAPGVVKVVKQNPDFLISPIFYGGESVGSDKNKTADETLAHKEKIITAMGGQGLSLAVNETSVENKDNELFFFWNRVGLILIVVALMIVFILFGRIFSDFRIIRWYRRKR